MSIHCMCNTMNILLVNEMNLIVKKKYENFPGCGVNFHLLKFATNDHLI